MKDDLTIDTERLNGSTKRDDATERVGVLIDTYAAMVNASDDDSERLTDLLADLRHWAAATGVDFDSADSTALMHFEHESDD